MIPTILSELAAGSGQKQTKLEHTDRSADDLAFGDVLAATDSALETLDHQKKLTVIPTSAEVEKTDRATADAPEKTGANAAVVSAPSSEKSAGVLPNPSQLIPSGLDKEPMTTQPVSKNDAAQIAKDNLQIAPSQTTAARSVEASLERSAKMQPDQGARLAPQEDSQTAQRAIAIGTAAKPAISESLLRSPKQLNIDNAAVAPRANETSKPTPAPTTDISASSPAVVLARSTALVDSEFAEKNQKPVVSELMTGLATSERPQFTPTAQAAGHPSSTPETARHAASQIAVAVSNATGKTTEITLNPEELGRVRLSLKASDRAIVMHVSAERPETQDLLRRHMDILAQEFRQLGSTSISFSIEQQSNAGNAQDQHPEEVSELEVQSLAAIPQATSRQITSGLDLRI